MFVLKFNNYIVQRDPNSASGVVALLAFFVGSHN